MKKCCDVTRAQTHACDFMSRNSSAKRALHDRSSECLRRDDLTDDDVRCDPLLVLLSESWASSPTF